MTGLRNQVFDLADVTSRTAESRQPQFGHFKQQKTWFLPKCVANSLKVLLTIGCLYVTLFSRNIKYF